MATPESTTAMTDDRPSNTPAMPRFAIDPEVRALGVRGAFAVMEGLDNHVPPSELDAYRAELLDRLRGEIDEDFIARDPVLAGFRALHDRIGRSNRRFPASAEALASLFLRKGVVPAINPLVDLYNGVSLETRLSLGAHDLAQVRGAVTLRLTTGVEPFVPLGATDPEPVGAGEYAYVDEANRILCRLEHRQCEATKVTADTTAGFYILQGNAATDASMLEAALDRLVKLTARFCGGRVTEAWIVA
jgi:DNA/RNA-binding domain of Phe-tRNA-synthetase-like protein